jgi:hypothetical protein
MKEDEKDTRARDVKSFLKEKAGHFSIKWQKRAPQKTQEGEFSPHLC